MTPPAPGDTVTIACAGELYTGEVVGYFNWTDGDGFITSARRNDRRLCSYFNRYGVKWVHGHVTADSDAGKALLAAEEASPKPVEHFTVDKTGKIVPHVDSFN